MVTNVLAKNQEVLLTVKRIGINGEGIGYSFLGHYLVKKL